MFKFTNRAGFGYIFSNHIGLKLRVTIPFLDGNLTMLNLNPKYTVHQAINEGPCKRLIAISNSSYKCNGKNSHANSGQQYITVTAKSNCKTTIQDDPTQIHPKNPLECKHFVHSQTNQNFQNRLKTKKVESTT